MTTFSEVSSNFPSLLCFLRIFERANLRFDAQTRAAAFNLRTSSTLNYIFACYDKIALKTSLIPEWEDIYAAVHMREDWRLLNDAL